MRVFMKYISAFFLKILLKVFYIFPFKTNRVMFLSFEGNQFSCSPKYIYESLKNEKNIEFIWVLNNISSNKENFEYLNTRKNVVTVGYRSFKFFYYIITSKVIVNNQFSISYIPFRKKQVVIGTWHGGGAYKKCHLDVDNTKINISYTKFLEKNINYAISSCKSFTEAFKSAYLISEDKFLSIGLPRNDILINNSADHLHEKVRKKYNIPKDDGIALYAPTFRSKKGMETTSFILGNFNMDIKRLKTALEKRFLKKFHIIFRAHPKLKNIVFNEDVINASDYSDMQELLYVSDVLINDYSSSMWDFSFTNKPCFIYAEDLNDYLKSRDFYTPIEKWPFDMAKNNDELEKIILNFDVKNYKEAVLKHHENLGSFEKGVATLYIKDLILKNLL